MQIRGVLNNPFYRASIYLPMNHQRYLKHLHAVTVKRVFDPNHLLLGEEVYAKFRDYSSPWNDQIKD